MLKLYYEIWVDFVYVPSKKNHKFWKFYVMLIMVFCQGNVFMVIMTIVQVHIFRSNFYDLHFLFGERWDKVPGGLQGIIMLNLPFVILNYFTIFYKNRYEKLILKYEYKKGKYVLNTILISGGIVLLAILILFIFVTPH